MEATTTVSIDDVEQIKVGQAVTVSPDGTGESLTGEVVAIGITPDSAASTTSYRVTIGLDGDTSALRNGNLGDAEITVATTSAAVAVPTSAVKLDTRGDYVVVVALDGTTTRQTVEIGVVGAQWIEITSGLDAGQTVALTDPSAAAGSNTAAATTGQVHAARGR
jgi:multidrug efflux pump subunit AcrA (membrane-fusion protein)